MDHALDSLRTRYRISRFVTSSYESDPSGVCVVLHDDFSSRTHTHTPHPIFEEITDSLIRTHLRIIPRQYTRTLPDHIPYTDRFFFCDHFCHDENEHTHTHTHTSFSSRSRTVKDVMAADSHSLRGGSSGRFSDKDKLSRQTLRFDPSLNRRERITSADIERLRPYVTEKLSDLSGVDDDILTEYVLSSMEAKDDDGCVDGKQIQIAISGFLEDKAGAFVTELWKEIARMHAHVAEDARHRVSNVSAPGVQRNSAAGGGGGGGGGTLQSQQAAFLASVAEQRRKGQQQQQRGDVYNSRDGRKRKSRWDDAHAGHGDRAEDKNQRNHRSRSRSPERYRGAEVL